MKRLQAILISGIILILISIMADATPTTLIWTPSTDIQPYKKTHVNLDWYFPVADEDANGNNLHVLQVYGPTLSLLSDKPEDNLLGKLWSPLGKVMVETGFDYKKGLGTQLDKHPWYFHFKLGIPEDAYFKNMPAFAVGAYDIGTKNDETDNNVLYFRLAKTVNFDKFNAGRVSAGYFTGNKKLLLDEDGEKDNAGFMAAWERCMPEISNRLWFCVDYQGTNSVYGALNYGFAWKFNDNLAVIVGYDQYNNTNFKDTSTLQIDIDF